MDQTLRLQSAFKTALALTITYGITLWMDWDKAYWAAFGVVFISLETAGQSLQKGALRLAGTFLGVVVAFLLLGAFPQERWLFILALSVHIAVCTYMMMGPRQQYFWHVSGFVCAIIALSAGPTSEASFDTAMLRAQQTGLGVLVFSFVTVVLWPSSSGRKFEALVRQHAEGECELLRAYIQAFRGEGDLPAALAKRQALNGLRRQAAALLDAAEMDTYEVWEARRAWRAYQAENLAYRERLERWRQGFPETAELDIDRLLPGVDRFLDELLWRLDTVVAMHDGKAPERRPVGYTLTVNPEAFAELNHFDKAAVEVTRARLLAVERCTRTIFHAVEVIRDHAALSDAPEERDETVHGLAALDLDRVFAALRAMTAVWIAWLIYAYVPDAPGGTSIMIMTISLGMALATMPQLSANLLIGPAFTALALAGVIYIFVMPKLSSFLELGPLLFAVTFFVFYFTPKPQQMLYRLLVMVLFLVITGIDNDQTYSFESYAATSLMFLLVLVVLAITSYLPIRMTPEVALRRLLLRFGASANYLLGTMAWRGGRQPTRWARFRRDFHLHEVATIPDKARSWLRALAPEAVPPDARPHLAAVIDGLDELGFRLKDLVEARTLPQADQVIAELQADIRDWRIEIQEQLALLKSDADRADVATGARIAATMATLEATIEGKLSDAKGGEISDEESANMYRFLGALRGVGGALEGIAKPSLQIDWPRFREARF